MRSNGYFLLGVAILFMLSGSILALDTPDIEECPKAEEALTPCVQGKRRLTKKYYKIESGKCKLHYTNQVVACGKKGKCPLVRFVSSGKCREGFQKTLIVRYKWHQYDQTCKKHNEFIGEVCDQKLEYFSETANSSCPAPVYFEKPCEMDLRPVFTIFYERIHDKCSKRIRYMSEPCALFSTGHKCPEKMMKTKGPCDKDGFQYILWKTYRFDENQKCMPVNKITYEKCKLSEGCPDDQVIKTFNECVHGKRHVLVSVFKMVKGTCKSDMVVRFEPCGKSLLGHCSKTRFVQRGPCETDGTRKFLITHYEKGLDKICRRKKSFVTRKCHEKDPFESAKGCPESKHHQFECKDDFRRVLRDYYVKEASGKCHKRRELAYEPCRDTSKHSECPWEVHDTKGPCIDGFMTITQSSYSKDDMGCHKHETKTHVPCNSIKS